MKKFISVFALFSLGVIALIVRLSHLPHLLFAARARFTALFSKNQISHFKSFFQKILSRQNRHLIHVGVVLIALAVAGFNLVSRDDVTVSAKESSLLVDALFPQSNNYEIVKNDGRSPVITSSSYLSFTSIASAAPQAGLLIKNKAKKNRPAAKKSASLSEDSVLTKNSNVKEAILPGTQKYNVAEGDTISSIALRFGVDEATILQENNLYADDIIKPGMELTILPISGTTELVDSGETIASIAQAHEADEEKILKYNKLVTASDIEVGQILIIPDGKREIKERPRPEPEPVTLAAETESQEVSGSDSSVNHNTQNHEAPQGTTTSTLATSRNDLRGNRFPWGYCTWYAAARRPDVTWMGNAKEWMANASAQGRAVGKIPAVGAIVQTNESWWGHVGIVDAVNGDTITVSEMNYQGFGVISTRTISVRNPVIQGYIY